jgi:hypothetical protein
MLSLLQVTFDIASEAQSPTGGGEALPGSTTTIGAYITSLLSAVMVIGTLMLLMYLLWGGIEWISAGGDSGKIQKARDKITQSVIGLIVLASTLAIFSLVQQFVGVEVLDVGDGASGAARAVGSGAAQAGAAARAMNNFRSFFGR